MRGLACYCAMFDFDHLITYTRSIAEYIKWTNDLYRGAFNVGRILCRVATLRNIATDLLRSLMIKSLIEYFQRGSAQQINTFDVFNTGLLLLKVAKNYN